LPFPLILLVVSHSRKYNSNKRELYFSKFSKIIFEEIIPSENSWRGKKRRRYSSKV